MKYVDYKLRRILSNHRKRIEIKYGKKGLKKCRCYIRPDMLGLKSVILTVMDEHTYDECKLVNGIRMEKGKVVFKGR